MKPVFQVVLREEFIEVRYKNYLGTKAYLDEIDPERKFSYLTDLDKIYDGETKPQKDIILCDSCNEDIDDPQFIFLESQNCYHAACVRDRDWFIHKEPISYENVVELFSKKGHPVSVLPTT